MPTAFSPLEPLRLWRDASALIVSVVSTLVQRWKLLAEGGQPQLDIYQAAMQCGWSDDIQAQHLAVDVAQRLGIAPLGGGAQRVVSAAVAGEDVAPRAQGIAAEAQHPHWLLGARKLVVNLAATLQFLRSDIVALEQVIGHRLVTSPDVLIQPQGLARAAEIVELAFLLRLLDALLDD